MNDRPTEKRKFKRVGVYIPIRYRNNVYIATSCQKGGVVRDIGLGGFRLVNDFLPIESKISVEIYVRETDIPIIAEASIVWVQKISSSERYCLGVMFTDITYENLTRLRRYIEMKLSILAA